MPQNIDFLQGIKCINTGVPQSPDVIDLDRTATYTNQFGSFVSATAASYGHGTVTVKMSDVSKSGTIMLGFHGDVRFSDCADWYGSHQYDPMNIICIPFDRFGTINYLVFTLGVLTRSTSDGIVFYHFSASIGWMTDPADYSTFTSVRNVAAGSMASNYTRQIIIDSYYLLDDVFTNGLDPEEYPLYRIALGFCFRLNQGSGNVETLPTTFTLTTNNGGTMLTTNPMLFSLREIVNNNYGWPTWYDESPEVGPPSDEDGYDPNRTGAFDDQSDDLAIPTSPTLGVSNVGFVRVYNTGLNDLRTLGVELFPQLSYSPPSPISDNNSVSEAIVDGFNQIVTFLANIPSFFEQIVANQYINYVIDCHMIPCSPGAGSSEAIHVGGKELTTYAGRIYNDYVDVPCGSINIGEYYGNFADYYANAKLYLPFVGFVPTRPEWFTGSTLSVDYKFNVIDGSFMAYVRSGGKHVGSGGTTIVGQYGGNACVHLPITGVTYASMVSGLVGAGAGMMAGAATGNVAAIATSAIGAAGAHGDIAASNSYNGSAAFLSCRYPFLMIERPVSSYARNYQHELGIPANVYGRLGDVTGFIQMANVHLDGIDLTEPEKEELASLLRDGVIN